MKAMIFAFAAIVVIAIGANLILESMGDSSAEANVLPSVRLD